MPMRGELAPPAAWIREDKETDRSVWAVIGFCAVGLTFALYLAATTNDLPALITRFNVF